MGCDGGTIPTRDELVRLKKKPEQKDKTADLAAKWKLCAITQEPLRQPVMACELGRLYNKESVLELLIDRSKFECASSFEHLRGLKDVKELKLTENKNFKQEKSEKGDGYIDTQVAQFICPVVGLEMNGSYKFCFLWTCGCVMSERALKEIKAQTCHKCGRPFEKADMVTLNGTEEEVEAQRTKMEAKRLQQKLEKKAKKAKKSMKEETATSATSTEEECGPSTSKQTKLDSKDSKLTNGVSHKDKLVNGSQSKLANGSQSKLGNGLQTKLTNEITELSKGKGSIQKDPKASTAYKSLFTTSDKAKNQMKGHWVTSNPYWM